MDNPIIIEWINTKPSAETRRSYTNKMKLFLNYFKMTPENLLDLDSRSAKNLALKFQNENGESMSNNTILSYLTAVGSFFDYYDKPIRLKKKQSETPS